jgi:hypothetical protein
VFRWIVAQPGFHGVETVEHPFLNGPAEIFGERFHILLTRVR